MPRSLKIIVVLLFVLIQFVNVAGLYGYAEEFTGNTNNLVESERYNDIINKIYGEYNTGGSIDDIMAKYNCKILLAGDNLFSGIKNSKWSRSIYYYFNYGIVIDFTPTGYGHEGIICIDLESRDFVIEALTARDRGIMALVIFSVVGCLIVFVVYIAFRIGEYKLNNSWKKHMYK